MGALCRPPSLAWPAGPSGRAWFRSSHLALRKREGYVRDGGVLRAEGHGASGTEGAPVPDGRTPLRSGGVWASSQRFHPRTGLQNAPPFAKTSRSQHIFDMMGKSHFCSIPRKPAALAAQLSSDLDEAGAF